MYQLHRLYQAVTHSPAPTGVAFVLNMFGRCRYLISRARGPLRPAFQACRGAVRAHAPMAQFLLNHLVADVLAFGDKEAGDQVGLVFDFNKADATTFSKHDEKERCF